MLKTSCTIQEPFSANNMYTPVAKGKMVKSKKYKGWIEANTPILKNNLLPAAKFPIDVEILIMADVWWKMKSEINNMSELRLLLTYRRSPPNQIIGMVFWYLRIEQKP